MTTGGRRQRLIQKADSLLREEKGTVFKDPGGNLNICLVYPNVYHVGMSNLGFQGVYGMLNRMDGVLCERAFLPDPEDIREYETTELFSLESKRQLGRFDMIAFSVPFENDYPNIPAILDLAGITPLARERGPREPLLLLGGIAAFSNPEPVAGFFDIVFIGEAEPLLPPFVEAAKRAEGRDGFLKDLLGLPGMYLPSFYEVSYQPGGPIKAREAASGAPEAPGAPEVIKKQFASGWRDFSMRHSILTPNTEFSNMRLVEIMRGCPWSCSFCLTGHVYNPPRIRPAHDVKKEIEEGRALIAGHRIGLVGPSISDYRELPELLRMEGVDFSITSLRAGGRSIGLLPFLKGMRSISIAAEAGTDRLRGLINKKITEEEILETSRAVLSEGINLRIYFMAGLPSETDEDTDALINLVGRIRDIAPRGRITLTISTFVPKPFTCFEWHPMERPEVVKARLKRIKKSLGALKAVSVFHDLPKYACMQGVFAMGDRRLTPAILAMAREGLDYRAALKKTGIPEDFYIFRRKPADEALPWDFIDSGVSREALRAEYERAITPTSDKIY
ncbi:MAG: radical SAM protein [Nitrospiraceae bacterium]|nr:radical SAM protein [Nitrospiraceae bacterium]